MENNKTYTIEIFSKRLKELRTREGLKQKEFADLVGMSTQIISSYENGESCPKIDSLMIIANTFNCSIEWLCGGDMPQLTQPKTYKNIIQAINYLDDIFGYNLIFSIEDYSIPGTDTNDLFLNIKIYDNIVALYCESVSRIKTLHLMKDLSYEDYHTLRDKKSRDFSNTNFENTLSYHSDISNIIR